MDDIVEYATTLLSSLSTDALLEITELLTGDDTSRLIMCGSRALNHKLGPGGGVKTYSLRSSIDFIMRWPAVILPYLPRLETFRIAGNQLSYGAKVINPDFATLPRNLKHLDVEFDNDVLRLFETLTTLPDHFVQLETVRVGATILDYNIRSEFDRANVIRALPRSVKSIHIVRPTEGGRTHAVYIEDLSHNLAIIRTNSTLIASRALDDAERRAIMGEAPCSDEEKQHIVSGLTQYSTNVAGGDWMAALPAHLQSLTIAKIDPNYLPLLPPNLTTLSVDCAPSRAFIVALPRSLTHLYTRDRHSAGNIQADDIAFLPRGLIQISGICLPKRLDAECAARLPRSLIKLGSCAVDWDAIPHLPPGIVELVMASIDQSAHKLPAACKHLSLQALSNATIGRLPPSLTHLRIKASVYSIAAIAALPTTLTSLRIDGPRIVDEYPANYFTLLPRGLRSFIHGAYSSDPAVEAYPSSDLPRALTELVIGTEYITTVEWFANLPPGLVRLSLSIQTLDMASAKALALHTTIVNLSIRMRQWDVTTLPYMPPHLDRLHIGCDKRNVDEVSHADRCAAMAALPRRLATCHIPSLNLRARDMYLNMPTTITSMTIDGRPSHWFEPSAQYPRVINLGTA